MKPRPRSRKKPVEYVPPLELVEEIRQRQREGELLEAIVVGRREWDVIRAQPEAAEHLWGLIPEEPMLAGVSVIIKARWARPKVCNRDELEEAMNGAGS